MLHNIQSIIVKVIAYVADRFEAKADYPWIDTKFDIFSGEDYDGADLLRGPETVYSWIQGRGLEALAGHCWFLREEQGDKNACQLAHRLENIIRQVAMRLQESRRHHGGRLFFTMDPEGTPFRLEAQTGQKQFYTVTEETAYNFSDLFGAKGLFAAGQVLGDAALVRDAASYSFEVYRAMLQGRFVSDQQALDPKNPVTPVAGRHSHGPLMIQIGAAALLTRYLRSPEAITMGLTLIETILRRYVNGDQRWPHLQTYDYVEFLDDAHEPYRQNGHIVSDPGHALEFVGLAMKFLLTAVKLETDRDQQRRIKECLAVMPAILMQNFQNGFSSRGEGIVKLYSLSARRAINSDMPWWPLPETIRAAAYVYREGGAAVQSAAAAMILSCYRAFQKNYVCPARHYFQYQTCDASGRALATIPATPDLDPGYHTGLSLIDAWPILQTLKIPG